MKVFPARRGWMVRAEQGERIPDVILDLARRHRIEGGIVTGIGAIDEVEVGLYDLNRKVYVRRKLDGVHELLSMQGNLALVQGAPFLHAHVSLLDEEFGVAGGHLFGARVAITGEFFVEHADLELTRSLDEEIGLALLEGHE